MKTLLGVLLLSVLIVVNAQAQDLPSVTADQLMKRTKGSDTCYVLNFWATWCVPCIAELPAFEAINQEYAKKKVKVLLVSLDFAEAYPAQIQSFIKKKKLTSDVLWFKETDANLFIPKIDDRWSGALPATLIIDGKTGKREFLEKKVTKEDLETLIQSIRD